MKKLLFPLLFLPFALCAQQDFEPGFRYGLHGGLNASKIFSDSLAVQTAFYPFVGVSVSREFSPHWNMYLGLQYSYRGSTNETAHYFKLRNSYIDIQLLPQFNFWDILKIEAGIQYSILASAKYIYLDKDQKSGSNYSATKGFSNQIEPILGVHLRVLESFDFGVRYSVPLEKSDYSNFQMVLNLNLNKIFNIESSHSYRKLSKALVKPLEVKKLILRNADVSQLNKDIGKFLNLEELDISNNKLTTLPADIEKLVNLDKLNISDNQLKEIPASVCKLTNLLNLNAANNAISFIPNEIDSMRKLNRLNLENNKIALLPLNFYLLKNLAYLNLLKNQATLVIESDIMKLGALRELRIDKTAKLPANIGSSNPNLKIEFYNPSNQ